MLTQNFYSRKGNAYCFSKQQGSDFAKRIAGDFNPLHNVDNSRFCIPGDLLFAVILSKYGISREMNFDFQGMVGGDTPVSFIVEPQSIVAKNEREKNLLQVSRSGDITHDSVFIEGLVKAYVAFSGKTFPHIIIKLMQQEDAMINTRRPMVIYDQMSLSFERFSTQTPEVHLADCDFEVNGKRGIVTMHFDLRAENQSIGRGEKKIIMSGLRPYGQHDIDYLVDSYNANRDAFFAR